MSLFPKPLGSIVLPPLPVRKHKAGSNWIVQHVFQGATTKAQIAPSDIKGHDLVTTSLQPPYRDFLLRHKGARKIVTDLPVLTSSEPVTYEDQPETFDLRWDSLGRLETYWHNPTSSSLYRDLKRRHETWAREGATRFVKGDMKKLSYFKEKARRSKLDFEMILVHVSDSCRYARGGTYGSFRKTFRETGAPFSAGCAGPFGGARDLFRGALAPALAPNRRQRRAR